MSVLLLACLIPRAYAAWRWDVVWIDSFPYLRACDGIANNDPHAAFDEFGLNLYPLVVLAIRKLGLDWQIAGKWCNTLLATATVLPLFGWIRRQFDDRVAVVACLCYAVHGKLIVVSPLMNRDPLFWFLLAMVLYCAWRAVTEVRLGLFLAAGLSLTLAVHTRTEGWLLAAPLVLWSAMRLPAVAGARLRLAIGVGLCLAVVPSSVTVVNLTWLRDNPRWEFLCARHVQLFKGWWQSGGDELTSEATSNAAASPSASPAAPAGTDTPVAGTPSRFTAVPKVAGRLLKGYTYVPAALLVLGIWGWRRTFFRRDHQALFVVVLFMVAMIWIRHSQAGTDIRYFLPAVIITLPWIALGAWGLADALVRALPAGVAGSPAKLRAVVGAVAVVLAAGNLAEAKLSSTRNMRQQAALGKWVLETHGPGQRIRGGPENLLVMAYYAEGIYGGVFDLPSAQAASAAAIVGNPAPDVLVLWMRGQDEPDGIAWTELLERSPYDYHRVSPADLPAECEHVILLLQEQQWQRICRERAPSRSIARNATEGVPYSEGRPKPTKMR